MLYKTTALLLVNLVLAGFAVAKKEQIYSCQQADGSTVIQDRRCQVTQLQQAKVKPTQRKAISKNKPNSKVTTQLTYPKPSKQTAKSPNKNQQSRSPYFTFGWNEFIPKNWQIHQSKSNLSDQWLLSKTQFKVVAEFNEGVRLDVYADTMRRNQLAAFAQALLLYHRIRDNPSFKLLDSQFKVHSSYKVFNIKYMQPDNKIALTEFYIDESNNDLFVVTVQAKQANWQLNWNLAESIIVNL